MLTFGLIQVIQFIAMEQEQSDVGNIMNEEFISEGYITADKIVVKEELIKLEPHCTQLLDQVF